VAAFEAKPVESSVIAMSAGVTPIVLRSESSRGLVGQSDFVYEKPASTSSFEVAGMLNVAW
jgi:hypothetical protein